MTDLETRAARHAALADVTRLAVVDLLALQELELRPGEQRQFKIAAGPEARHLGLIAAYRDLPNTRWRIRLDVQPGARNQFTLALDEHGINQQQPTGEP